MSALQNVCLLVVRVESSGRGCAIPQNGARPTQILSSPASTIQGIFEKSPQASYHRSTSSRRLIDTRKIAWSECPNECAWQESWCAEWSFVDSQNLDVVLENATTSRSHDSFHTMELSLQISATPPAPICMLCERGVVLKSSPRRGPIGLFRCWKFGCGCEHAVQLFPRCD